MGLAGFAALENGQSIAGPESFKKHEQRLAKDPRSMSRKVKESSNGRKAKKKVQKIHSAIANARKDFLHKTSTTRVDGHAGLAIEDLKVKTMSASAKGTLRDPGKNVAAKSGLNQALLDQGGGRFRIMSRRQDGEAGPILGAVPPMNPRRKCPDPSGGGISKDNRKAQAKFKGIACGCEGHADPVAAINT